METLVFIESANSGSSREALKVPKVLGMFTVLITGKASFVKNQFEFQDVGRIIYLETMTEHMIRLEIFGLQKEVDIKAIISFVDPFVSLAAQLSKECCQSTISIESIFLMEDKSKTRNAIITSDYSVEHTVVHSYEDIEIVSDMISVFPLIVKPTISSASRDVYFVQNRIELERMLLHVFKYKPNQTFMVEEYLDGPQYLAEVLVYDGVVMIVAVFKQTITRQYRFIVTGYELMEIIDESLTVAIKSIINMLGVVNSACHLELRHVKGNWKLVEINPRISGGTMNRMIEEAYGINLVMETIKLYLGLIPNLEKRFVKSIYTHYIEMETFGRLLKVDGYSKAIQHVGVKEVQIKPRIGSILGPPLSMGQRCGYVIACGKTTLEAKSNAINAASELKFYLELV